MTDGMTYEKTAPKKLNTEKPKRTKKMKKLETPAPVKQPASIKLSTIWKTLVYTFAVIGVILSVVYVNDIVDGIVDSRAEAKAQEILKAQPAAQVTELKANQ